MKMKIKIAFSILLVISMVAMFLPIAQFTDYRAESMETDVGKQIDKIKGQQDQLDRWVAEGKKTEDQIAKQREKVDKEWSKLFDIFVDQADLLINDTPALGYALLPSQLPFMGLQHDVTKQYAAMKAADQLLTDKKNDYNSAGQREKEQQKVLEGKQQELAFALMQQPDLTFENEALANQLAAANAAQAKLDELAQAGEVAAQEAAEAKAAFDAVAQDANKSKAENDAAGKKANEAAKAVSEQTATLEAKHLELGTALMQQSELTFENEALANQLSAAKAAQAKLDELNQASEAAAAAAADAKAAYEPIAEEAAQAKAALDAANKKADESAKAVNEQSFEIKKAQVKLDALTQVRDTAVQAAADLQAAYDPSADNAEQVKADLEAADKKAETAAKAVEDQQALVDAASAKLEELAPESEAAAQAVAEAQAAYDPIAEKAAQAKADLDAADKAAETAVKALDDQQTAVTNELTLLGSLYMQNVTEPMAGVSTQYTACADAQTKLNELTAANETAAQAAADAKDAYAPFAEKAAALDAANKKVSDTAKAVEDQQAIVNNEATVLGSLYMQNVTEPMAGVSAQYAACTEAQAELDRLSAETAAAKEAVDAQQAVMDAEEAALNDLIKQQKAYYYLDPTGEINIDMVLINQGNNVYPIDLGTYQILLWVIFGAYALALAFIWLPGSKINSVLYTLSSFLHLAALLVSVFCVLRLMAIPISLPYGNAQMNVFVVILFLVPALVAFMMHVSRVQNTKRSMIYVFCTVLSILALLPFWIMLVNATRNSQAIQQGISLIPGNSIANNWNVIAKQESFNVFNGFKNSVIVSFGSTILSVYFSALTAYGFEVYDFKGKKFLWAVVMGIIMIPGQVTGTGFYMFMYQIGMINNHLALIIPSIAAASTVFFFRQYLKANFQKSLVEASRIDGAGEFFTYNKIIMPIMIPAMATMGIMAVIGSWNNYLTPLMLLSDKKLHTLPLLVYALRGDIYRTEYGSIYLGLSLTALPLIIVYFALSKYIIAGVAVGGVKE